MKVEPINESDFNLVEIKTTNECNPTPHCINHGAMNNITIDGIWRCLSVVGYREVYNGNARGEIHLDGICRAGCYEKKCIYDIWLILKNKEDEK